MANYRGSRINEEMKREIAQVIRELKDPRIPVMTSVVAVNVTPDLKFAKVFVSIMGGEAEVKDAVKGLNSAAGFVRREIGARMKLRITPEIHFEADDSISYGAHISKLLNDIEGKSHDK